MRFIVILKWFTIVFLLLVANQFGHARSVHSYADENGVLVYFNVPQKHTDIDGIPVVLPEVVPSPVETTLKTKLVSSLASSRYDSYISKHATTYGVDPDLVRAVMATESGFNSVAVSNKGACGLMQLIPSTARRFGVKNIFHPDENIEGGTKYLKFLLDTFNNDLKLTLAAYNAGENVVKRVGGIPNYRETSLYVNKIISRYGDTYRLSNKTPEPADVHETQATHRIYRTVDAGGNIVYTNRPTSD